MVIVHENIMKESIYPTKSISDKKAECTKREFLELFYENYCFEPIGSFEISNSRDCVRYENLPKCLHHTSAMPQPFLLLIAANLALTGFLG